MLDEPGKESEDTRRLRQLLRNLTTEQVRYVQARLDTSSDREAARVAGVSEQAPYKWRYAGVPIDEAVSLLAADGVSLALEMRHRALTKAMQVKIDGLEERDRRLRQAVATEILEAELGKATQRHEVSGKGGAPLVDVDAVIAALRKADETLRGGQ